MQKSPLRIVPEGIFIFYEFVYKNIVVIFYGKENENIMLSKRGVFYRIY